MEKSAYPRIKHVIILCIIFLGIQILGGLVLGLNQLLLQIGTESLAFGIGTIILYIVSFAVIIYIGFKKTGKKFNEVFLLNNVSSGVWVSVIIFMFGFVIISSEIDNLITYILPMPAFLEETFQTMINNDYFIVSVILVGILPAIFEEFFFRGVVISGFRENYPQVKTILVSALLFGFIHLNPYQFVTAFLIGIIMAWSLFKTNSILPAMYMHFFNNMTAVIVMRFNNVFYIEGFNAVYGEHSFQPWWFNLIGIALTGAGAWLFIKEIKKTKVTEKNEPAVIEDTP